MSGPRRCACPECAVRRDRELCLALESKFGLVNPDPRRQFIEGLRAVASFYETHDAVYYDGMGVSLNMYMPGTPELARFSAAARALGCSAVSSSEGIIAASRQFGSKVRVGLFARQGNNSESQRAPDRQCCAGEATNPSVRVSTKQVQGVPHL